MSVLKKGTHWMWAYETAAEVVTLTKTIRVQELSHSLMTDTLWQDYNLTQSISNLFVGAVSSEYINKNNELIRD